MLKKILIAAALATPLFASAAVVFSDNFESLAAQMDAAKPDYAVLESSLMALEICEAAYASHRCHRQIMLPLTGAETPDCGVWDPGRPYAGTGGGRDGRKL